MPFGTFQRSVNADPAPGLEGDWASANTYASMLAGEGALVAGTGGLIVGRFGFALDADGTVTNAAPNLAVVSIGFVHRNQPVLITGWFDGYGSTVQPGLEVTLFTGGDFWARFPAGATKRQKVFASVTDGSCASAAAGATVAGYTETAFVVGTSCLAGEIAKISA